METSSNEAKGFLENLKLHNITLEPHKHHLHVFF